MMKRELTITTEAIDEAKLVASRTMSHGMGDEVSLFPPVQGG